VTAFGLNVDFADLGDNSGELDQTPAQRLCIKTNPQLKVNKYAVICNLFIATAWLPLRRNATSLCSDRPFSAMKGTIPQGTTVTRLAIRKAGGRQTGTVRPVEGKLPFSLGSIVHRLDGLHGIPALVCSVYAIGILFAGKCQALLTIDGESIDQVLPELTYPVRLLPRPALAARPEGNAGKGCLTAITPTVFSNLKLL
jgi:hypothetical protein